MKEMEQQIRTKNDSKHDDVDPRTHVTNVIILALKPMK